MSASDKARLADLVEHARLRDRAAVGQEDVRAVPEGFRQHRLEGPQDVQVDLQGVARVHVLVIAALPAKGLARLRDQAGGVDAAARQQAAVLVGEVFAHDALPAAAS